MSSRKPTLAGMILHRHLWAATLTLGVVMVGMLALADQWALRNSTQALIKDLHETKTSDTSPVPHYVNGPIGHSRTGHITLDAQGHWQRSTPPNRHTPPHRPWAPAPHVLANGETHGVGPLPWTEEPAVWAARAVKTPAGERNILVAWHHIGAVRAASGMSYLAVVLATLLAFAVSMMLALNTARYVTGVIDQVSESGTRMAKGDFQIRLPEQPTVELDRMSSVITALAGNLEQAIGDLQVEHTRLTSLENLQRQFVADASHELRAPLASMSLTLSAWQDGLLRPEEQTEALGQLRREAKRLGSLVTRLLDLSRIESGREKVTLAPLPVSEVGEEILAAFRNLPGAAISLDLPETLPAVLADRDALYRVLQNLVENARRFTPPDGAIRIWSELEDGWVRLGVSDSGCGIAPDDLPRIWDRFARAEEARAQGIVGSGLGLAIVKALTEAMGGEVGAISTPGKGATMWLRLRVAEGDAEEK